MTELIKPMESRLLCLCPITSVIVEATRSKMSDGNMLESCNNSSLCNPSIGRYGIRVKKKMSNGGMAIKKEKAKALALCHKSRLEKCLRI